LSEVLGVVLAGGENRRYGSHKALEILGDERIIDRVIDALSAAVDEVALVANDSGLYETIGLEVRPDLIRGLGVLGGIFTAVSWAAEKSCGAALVVACDMPFDRAVIAALVNVETRIMPLERVEAYGDPGLLFLNVNRPEDRKHAEALLIAGFPEGRTAAKG
jgi:molybdopterin-guanine dinucleotide biosynthesis protein A